MNKETQFGAADFTEVGICVPGQSDNALEPQETARTPIAEDLRPLEWNEVVRDGDFVAHALLGFEPWEGPAGFQAGSFFRTIYRTRTVPSKSVGER